MPPLKDPNAALKVPVNIVLFGASSVGKTTVALQFVTGKAVRSESCNPTIENTFYKELKASYSDENDAAFMDGAGEKGVECFWKMDNNANERKPSSGSLQSLTFRIIHKSKGSNTNEIDANNVKTVLRVTDTASFKLGFEPRKSLRQRLAKRLTMRRNGGSPAARRYRHNTQSPAKNMNAVPSFIYRKGGGGTTLHDKHMRSADAFILVYSVKDRSSFQALQEIRSEIHAARERYHTNPDSVPQSPTYNGNKERVRLNSAVSKSYDKISEARRLPPIAVVGTHIDLTAPTLSPCVVKEDETKSSNESLLNYAFTFKSPRRGGSRRRKFQKQISLTPEILTETTKPRGPDVTAEHVRGVVGSWPECVGYAEVSNDQPDRVHRVFEHLTVRVMQNRMSHGKKSPPSTSSSPRKRIDSALSAFRRQSTNDEEENTSCCFCFPKMRNSG